MFGNQLNNMMKQAQQMQAKLMEVQKQMEELEVEGSSGGGMVKVIVSGKGLLKRISIDPSLINPEEAEMLEDLIVAAVSDGAKKAETKTQEEMAKVTGGLKLPAGMKMPF